MLRLLSLRRQFLTALSFSCLMAFAIGSPDQNIEGTVKVTAALSKKIPSEGVLFVFARSRGVSSGPPAAVIRIINPTFPIAFSLGPENAMVPGIPFHGPFDITARYSPSGDVMKKPGSFEGQSKGSVSIGKKNVEIAIDKAL